MKYNDKKGKKDKVKVSYLRKRRNAKEATKRARREVKDAIRRGEDGKIIISRNYNT